MEIYKYTNKEAQIEDVTIEKWAWLAIYKDGSNLKQFDDETMKFNRFDDIDKKNLKVFVVYNTQSEGRYETHIEEGMTPIFFYRITVFNSKQHNERRERVPIFGYKETFNGKSIKTLIAVHPSGAISIRNKD